MAGSTSTEGCALIPELSHLPRPIVGWFGLGDERLHLDVLRTILASRPKWSVVLLGEPRVDQRTRCGIILATTDAPPKIVAGSRVGSEC